MSHSNTVNMKLMRLALKYIEKYLIFPEDICWHFIGLCLYFITMKESISTKKLWKSISRLPDIAHKCFFIQNEVMDLSFQKNIVFALLDEYCQSNRVKTQSHFYWDTLYQTDRDTDTWYWYLYSLYQYSQFLVNPY